MTRFLSTLIRPAAAALVVSMTLSGAQAHADCPITDLGQVAGSTNAVFALNNKAYFGVGPNFNISDVTNPASPVKLGSIRLGDLPADIIVSGNLAYVAAGRAGLYILNISAPASPTITAHLDTNGFAYRLAISGSTLC